MNISIEIGPGELLDRISILQIKLQRIGDEEKLKNISFEHAGLDAQKIALLLQYPSVSDWLSQLSRINALIWDLEESARQAEREGLFGEEYIRDTREIHRLNDARARAKMAVNLLCESELIEEKSHDEPREKP